jgi:hypothetical protein
MMMIPLTTDSDSPVVEVLSLLVSCDCFPEEPVEFLFDAFSLVTDLVRSKTVGQMEIGGTMWTRFTPRRHSVLIWLAQRLCNWKKKITIKNSAQSWRMRRKRFVAVQSSVLCLDRKETRILRGFKYRQFLPDCLCGSFGFPRICIFVPNNNEPLLNKKKDVGRSHSDVRVDTKELIKLSRRRS